MVKVRVTESKGRRIAVFAAALLLIAFFAFFPNSYSVFIEGVPLYAAYFLPIFMACVLASVLLDVRIESGAVKIVIKVALILLCLCALFYASEELIERYLWYVMAMHPEAFLLGLGIMASIAFVFFALTGSVAWALRGLTIVVMVFCYVNYFVLQFRGTPLIPLDIFSAGTAMDVASNYTYAGSAELIASALTFAGIFVLAPRVKFPKPGIKVQVALRSATAVVAIAFFGFTSTRQFIYANNLQPNYWDQSQSAVDNGNIVNFYANIPDSFLSAPDGYSLEAVNEIASRYTSDSVDATDEKPDVILILGESWADFAPEGFVRTDKEVLTYMKSLEGQDNSLYNNLMVSVTGGGTSKSEFEVLTGANVEYGFSQAPFQFDVVEPIPNIVDSFKKLGYDTTAIHPGVASSWGRDEAFPLLGFDEFWDKEDLDAERSDYLRLWMRDSVIYDRTLEVLDEAGDVPQFLYLITIATHGGYTDEEFESTVQITSPQGNFSQTEQYLSLLNESDNDMEAFISALEQRERPTIVLFFGDHIPHVEDEFTEQGIEPSDPESWKYKTFYGMWANYELPETPYDDLEYFSLSYLGCYLMQKAELPLTGYQKFLLEGAKQYPVVSTVGFKTSDGESIALPQARDTTLYYEQSIMQYSFVADRENIPEHFFYLRE